jgi:hypothetical protein
VIDLRNGGTCEAKCNVGLFGVGQLLSPAAWTSAHDPSVLDEEQQTQFLFFLESEHRLGVQKSS